MTSSILWEHDEPIAKIKSCAHIEIPDWIESDISPYDVASIVQGGCASGAYMPAVTYHQAGKTMFEHGDDVLQYLEDHWGEIPTPPKGTSWSGIACFYLSTAVETWANSIETELDESLSDAN